MHQLLYINCSNKDDNNNYSEIKYNVIQNQLLNNMI